MPEAIPHPITVDFETLGIEGRPHYPPSPVGVSIKPWKKKAKYYAWGHVSGGNNCTWQEAKAALEKVWNSRAPLLFQNAKFDLAVADAHFDLPPPKWDRVHDTLFLLFLDDPRQSSFSLKPAAERLLNWPPEEQDAVANWLVEHQPIPGVKITRGKGKHNAGKYIAYAPGDLVGKYANGDTERTEAIFAFLYKSIKDRGMLGSYDRERRVLPVLLDIEKPGVQTDYKRLGHDVDLYQEVREKVKAWVFKRLKRPVDDFNINSGAQLLEALVVAGKVDPNQLLLTDTGNQSASKESLSGAMTDRLLQEMLAYLSELSTCLDTFMLNYYYTASMLSSHRIYTDWNQVRQDRQGGMAKGIVGTSTGRLSSTPNFQNISNMFPPHFKHLLDPKQFKTDAEYKKAVAALVKCPFDLPPLPMVRSYIIPFEGEIFIDRDYSQQELRILSHYEQGPLFDAYMENNWLDVHTWAKDEINALLSANFDRRPVKDIGFGLIYGMGVGKLAYKAGSTVDVAKQLKKAYLTIAPGLNDLYKDMRRRARDDEPIYTWGGREYYCEDPKLVDGRLRTFDYKMVNLLIQGSAADCTKEAFIRYHETKPPGHRLVLNVHDQLTSSIPRSELEEGMECMRVAMESVEFDVPMLTEGSWSDTTWSKTDLIDYDKKGVRL